MSLKALKSSAVDLQFRRRLNRWDLFINGRFLLPALLLCSPTGRRRLAVQFMFYIAPILGAEQTQKYFWKIFLDVIDGDPGSGVRKHCVRLIAILGSILGQEITEKDLVSLFLTSSQGDF